MTISHLRRALYLSLNRIFSGFPVIGFFLAVPALVLGIMGLRDRNRNPAIKGSIHAGIGIGCGALFTLLWGAAIIMIIVQLLFAPRMRP